MIGYGAYDGYRTLNGITIPPQSTNWGGESAKCGPTGKLCKDKVTKDDLTELLQLANKARNCARACAESSNSVGCKTCVCKAHLKSIVTKGRELLPRLKAQNSQAAMYLESVVLTGLHGDGVDSWVGDPSNGWNDQNYQDAKWETIYNSMDGSCIEHCGSASLAPFKTGDGTIISNLLKARDSIYFIANLTPQQNMRRVGYIQGKLSALEPKIQRKIQSIGGEYSVQGALRGTSWKNEQMELAGILTLIRDAWIEESSRTQLNAEALRLSKIMQEGVVKAAREGKKTGEIIDDANTIVESVPAALTDALDHAKDAAGLATCLAQKDHIYKLGCFYSGNRLIYGIIGTVALLGLLGWLIRPYITMWQLATG